jgi:hypothetical protein
VYKSHVPKIAAVTASIAWCALHLLGAGCSSSAPKPQQEQPAKQAPSAPPDPDLGDPLGASVIAHAREHAAGFTKAGKLFRGDLEAKDRQGFLAVLTYGKCYRFIGSGGPGVEDLELVLLDSNGVEMQRDTVQGPQAVVGETSSVCPFDAGAYRIEARMRAGHGAFAIGVYEAVN